MGEVGERRVPVEVDSLRRVFLEASPSPYEGHYHEERNQQGTGNKLLLPGGLNQPVGVRDRFNVRSDWEDY